MQIQCHHLDRWEYMNLDMIEEVLANRGKCAVLIGGATSSGKSFCAKNLKILLEQNGYAATIISTDSYNKGVTAIITDKVEKRFFGGKMPFKSAIMRVAFPIVRDTPFEEKFSRECCARIRQAACTLVPEAVLDTYIEGCLTEIKKLNFDEPDVYDLSHVAHDLKALLAGGKITRKEYSKVISEPVPSDRQIDGSQLKVFIVEGLYVLSDPLIKQLNRSDFVADFVEGSAKSLFLRRIIRDAKVTSSPTYFTIQMYFSNIVKSYNDTILPSAKNADIIFKNEMSFSELREGDLYVTKDKVELVNPSFICQLMNESTTESIQHQRDLYLRGSNESPDFNNLLRLREISEDGGKTFVPASLVHKGAPKTRRDGREIRPINILLREGEFLKAFSDEHDFLRKVQQAGFIVDRTVTKVKRKLKYHGYSLTLSAIEREGLFLEFSDPDIPQQVIDEIRIEASAQGKK